MIDYELAKKLKDAGFPQKMRVGENGLETEPNDGRISNEGGDWIYLPSLSELIEACGDGYFTLQSGQGLWQAGKTLNPEWSEGQTPEEAVARLWLALNKKA